MAPVGILGHGAGSSTTEVQVRPPSALIAVPEISPASVGGLAPAA
jgi:hypothetical protein